MCVNTHTPEQRNLKMHTDINLKYIETVKSQKVSQSNDNGSISADLDCSKYSKSDGDIVFVITQKLNLTSLEDGKIELQESFTGIGDLDRAIRFFDSVVTSLKMRFSH